MMAGIRVGEGEERRKQKTENGKQGEGEAVGEELYRMDRIEARMKRIRREA